MGSGCGDSLQWSTISVSLSPNLAPHIEGSVAYNIGHKLKMIYRNHDLIMDISESKHIKHYILRF